MFHGAVFGFFAFVIYDLNYIPNNIPNRDGYGGRIKFLTFWNMILQCVFFGVCTAKDAYHRQLQRLQACTNFRLASSFTLHNVCYWPFGVSTQLTVTCLSQNIGQIYLNVDKLCISHISTAFSTDGWLFHFITHTHQRNRHFWQVCFGLTYQIWLLWIKYIADFWTYPIFNILSLWQISIFLFVCNLVMIAAYLISEALHTFIWLKKIKSALPQIH